MDGSRGGSNAKAILPNYILGRTLGIGSFGKVKLGEHVPTTHKVAIKILSRHKIKDTRMGEKVRRETEISRLLIHSHIIHLYEVIETQTEIYLVMEYASSGELLDYLTQKGRLQEDEACHFFQQIISGVEYCHKKMIARRDLKPENLLLDSKHNIKIIDFGLSTVVQDGHLLRTTCGGAHTAAPEIISGKLYSGPEVDVWSCGVILYALLCGFLPFDDSNYSDLCRKIQNRSYTLPNYLSTSAKDLINRILPVDPKWRIRITEIRQHGWFKARPPSYLAVPPPNRMQEAEKIDVNILQEVVKMGFDKDQLVESLNNRIQNEATVSYYLLLDNRFHDTGGCLLAKSQETMI